MTNLLLKWTFKHDSIANETLFHRKRLGSGVARWTALVRLGSMYFYFFRDRFGRANLVLDLDVLDRDLEDTLLAAFRGALTSNSAPRATQLASRNHWRCGRVGSQLH
jgi:hypothetical protein